MRIWTDIARRPSVNSRMARISCMIVAGSFSLIACTNSARDSESTQYQTPTVVQATSGTVELKDAYGVVKGKATFAPAEGDTALKITIDLFGLKPGYYGVHVHDQGICTPSDIPAKNFVSAGKHFNKPSNKSIILSGNLVSVRVNQDGTGSTVQTTDAFNLKDLSQVSGTALVVHEKPSNFANIPARYLSEGKPGPDQATINTSDAGNRILCGVISEPRS